jgi:hypothetical protein
LTSIGKCGAALEAANHFNYRTCKAEPSNGQLIYKQHGVLSRDINSAQNMLRIHECSLVANQYRRPTNLTRESS